MKTLRIFSIVVILALIGTSSALSAPASFNVILREGEPYSQVFYVYTDLPLPSDCELWQVRVWWSWAWSRRVAYLDRWEHVVQWYWANKTSLILWGDSDVIPEDFGGWPWPQITYIGQSPVAPYDALYSLIAYMADKTISPQFCSGAKKSFLPLLFRSLFTQDFGGMYPSP